MTIGEIIKAKDKETYDKLMNIEKRNSNYETKKKEKSVSKLGTRNSKRKY